MSDFEESSNRLDGILISASQQQQQQKVNGNSRKRIQSSSVGDDENKSNTNGQDVSGGAKADEDDSDEDEPELMIIDFEYCSYNYRGFDLANHFLEWTFDYSNKDYPFFFHTKQQFPSAQQKKAFLDTYLKTSHLIRGGGGQEEQEEDVPVEVMEQAERDLLEREIDFFKCASHLFWSLWAIVYCDQAIEFGYWEYADCRLKEYFEAKQSYLGRYKKEATVDPRAQKAAAVAGKV